MVHASRVGRRVAVLVGVAALVGVASLAFALDMLWIVLTSTPASDGVISKLGVRMLVLFLTAIGAATLLWRVLLGKWRRSAP